MTLYQQSKRQSDLKKGIYKNKSAKNKSSDEENEDPFSLNHPTNQHKITKNVQNKRKHNHKTKDEWDAFQSFSTNTDAYTFTLQWNKDNYKPMQSLFNCMELRKGECKNDKIEIYLCILNDKQSIIDINLYQINAFIIEQKAATITIIAPSHSLKIHKKCQSMNEYSIDDDFTINLKTDNAPNDFFKFVEYIHQKQPSKHHIPTNYKKQINSKSDCIQTNKHRNGHNVPSPKYDKIQNPDARNKHEYGTYLDAKHSPHHRHRSVGNGSIKKRAKAMQKAAVNTPKHHKMAGKRAQERMKLIEKKTQNIPTKTLRNIQMNAFKEKKQCKNVNYAQKGKQCGCFMKRKINGRNVYNSRNKKGKLHKEDNKKCNGMVIEKNKYSSHRLSDIYSNGRIGECVGFKNLGNTCFLNAILRSIVNLKCFSNDIRRQYLAQIMMNEPMSLYKSFLELIFADLQNEKCQKKEVLDPYILKQMIGSKDSMFASYRQQDAHELFSFLLNAFHDEMYKQILKKYECEKEADNERKSELEYLSPIHSNFHFQIEFKYECTHCGYTRNKVESFREMSLDLPSIKKTQKQIGEESDDSKEDEKMDKNESNELEKLMEKEEEKLDAKAKGSCPDPNHGDKYLYFRTKGKFLHLYCRECNNALIESCELPPALHGYDPYKNIKHENENEQKSFYKAEVINEWTLNELLKAYFVKKKLEYKCERSGCGNNKVFVTSWFKEIPRCLALHIKRFVPKYNSYTKSHDKVIIEKDIDLNMFCNERLSLPPTPFGQKKNKMDIDKICYDADEIYERLFNSDKMNKNALNVCKCTNDLPLSLQPPLQKSYFEQKEQEKKKKKEEDDDDIVILDNNHNKNNKNQIPPKIEDEYKAKTNSIAGPLMIYNNKENDPNAINQTSQNLKNTDANSIETTSNDTDIFTLSEMNERVALWTTIDENWMKTWTKEKCADVLTYTAMHDTTTQEYAAMYAKYWKSHDVHFPAQNKINNQAVPTTFGGQKIGCANNPKKRKHGEMEKSDTIIIMNGHGDNGEPKAKKQKIGCSKSMNMNVCHEVDDEKCTQPTLPQIWQKNNDKDKNENDAMQQAINASLLSLDEDKARRESRNSSLVLNGDDNDEKLQQALEKSLTEVSLNGTDLNEVHVQNEEKNGKKLGNRADLNGFEPVCDEKLLPNDDRFTKYKLQSIVRHLGSNYQSGHYITDVYKNGNWKRHDDRYVSEITDEKATDDTAKKNAYIFFFVHQSALNK